MPGYTDSRMKKGDNEMVSLKLYVVNQSDHTRQKVEKLRADLTGSLGENFELLVLNIMDHLKAALEDDVMVTPTLIKASPLPARRIVGDLSDNLRILEGLGLSG